MRGRFSSEGPVAKFRKLWDVKGVPIPSMRDLLYKPLRTFLAGFLVILPLAITIAVITWLGSLVYLYFGPDSLFGQVIVHLGLPFGVSPFIAYLIGLLFSLLGIFVLGLLVQAGLQKGIQVIILSVVRRIPLVGSLYDLTNRFVGIFDKKEETDLKTMSSVWCTFGGGKGVAVLALLPTPEPIILNGIRHHVILIPSAPIPMNGALICVPEEWIRPASFGMEGLTSIYVSMGVALPKYLETLKTGKMVFPADASVPKG